MRKRYEKKEKKKVAGGHSHHHHPTKINCLLTFSANDEESCFGKFLEFHRKLIWIMIDNQSFISILTFHVELKDH